MENGNKNENVSGGPTTDGTYEYLRATRTYRKIDDDGDLCRHIDRAKKTYRVCYAGAAARALPTVHVGPCCADCVEDYRYKMSEDDGGSVWAGESLPIISVEEVE